MPSISPDFLMSSVFLYGSIEDAENGVSWGGSGFLLGVASRVNGYTVHLYAVSCDHVIHAFPVVRLTKANGVRDVRPGVDSDWTPHPSGDDVAIRDLGTVAIRDYRYIADTILLSQEDLVPDAVGPGDDCLMIGRYINGGERQFDQTCCSIREPCDAPRTRSPETTRSPSGELSG